jgi:hypothetical protein
MDLHGPRLGGLRPDLWCGPRPALPEPVAVRGGSARAVAREAPRPGRGALENQSVHDVHSPAPGGGRRPRSYLPLSRDRRMGRDRRGATPTPRGAGYRELRVRPGRPPLRTDRREDFVHPTVLQGTRPAMASRSASLVVRHVRGVGVGLCRSGCGARRRCGRCRRFGAGHGTRGAAAGSCRLRWAVLVGGLAEPARERAILAQSPTWDGAALRHAAPAHGPGSGGRIRGMLLGDTRSSTGRPPTCRPSGNTNRNPPFSAYTSRYCSWIIL